MSYLWELKDWPKFHWDSKRVQRHYLAADEAQKRLATLASVLEQSQVDAAEIRALVEEGVATSRIEGEVVDGSRLRSSMLRRMGMDADGLPLATRQTDGLAEILLDTKQHWQAPLTMERLSAWHAALFPTGYGGGLQKIRVAELRGHESMRVVTPKRRGEVVHYVAPPRDGLEAELHAFLDWFNSRAARIGSNGLWLAGVAHLWFVAIHPFEDGNGRLARAITDLAMNEWTHGEPRFYSLSSQILRNRRQYDTQLMITSSGSMDITEWLCWFQDQAAEACKDGERAIQGALAAMRFWTKFADAPLSERQRKVLRRMLDGEFGDGLSRRMYCGAVKVSDATAARDLSQMVKIGCLEQFGAGAGTRYRLAI